MRVKTTMECMLLAGVLAVCTQPRAAPDFGFIQQPPGWPMQPAALYASEQGAHAVLESLLQQTESAIVGAGCVSGTHRLRVLTDVDGLGGLILGEDLEHPALELRVVRRDNDRARGNAYTVESTGGSVLGRALLPFSGTFRYAIGSVVMDGTGAWSTADVVSPGVWNAQVGTVIEDFRTDPVAFDVPDDVGNASGLTANTIVAHGLHVVGLPGWPRSTYWRAARSWRDDGIPGETHILATRLVPRRKYGCRIAVDLQGIAGVELFAQRGTMTIDGPALLPTKTRFRGRQRDP
ncbi:MAG: hypothetical protein U1E83_02435 [Methylotetracoccus sp.]